MPVQQVSVDIGAFVSTLQQRIGALEIEQAKDVSTSSVVITPGHLISFTDATGTSVQDTEISAQSVAGSLLTTAGIQNELEPVAPAGQRDLWQYSTGATGNNLRYVSDTNFLFSTGTGNSIAYSTDGGVTFTTATYDIGPTVISDIAYGNGVYVVVPHGGGGVETYTSSDGINFTKQTNLPFTTSCIHFFRPAGLFIAGINASSTQGIMTSPDGLTWIVRTANMVNAWDMADNGVLCVATSPNAPFAMSSSDGINWTTTPSTIAATRTIAWSSDKAQWLINTFGATGGFVSTDGNTWTATGAIFPTTGAGNGLFWVGGNYQRWYLAGRDSDSNYSLWSTPDVSLPFVGTHLDGSLLQSLEYTGLYLPTYNRFLVGSNTSPFVAYSIARPYDLKALSDNIRVRGMPVNVAKYSTYGNFSGPNSTLTETTISTPTTPTQVLGNLVYQAAQPAGMVMSFDLNLATNTAAGDTLTLKYKSNGTTLLTQAVTAATGAQNINVRTNMTVQSSTVQISSIATGSGDAPTIAQANPAYTPTIANTFTITATWGLNTSTCTMNQLFATARFPNGA